MNIQISCGFQSWQEGGKMSMDLSKCTADKICRHTTSYSRRMWFIPQSSFCWWWMVFCTWKTKFWEYGMDVVYQSRWEKYIFQTFNMLQDMEWEMTEKPNNYHQRIHSSVYIAHVLPPAKRYQPGTLDNSESMMIDALIPQQIATVKWCLLTNCPEILFQFLQLQFKHQHLKLMTPKTWSLFLKCHNQIIHWQQALKYYHLALQHLFHMPINKKGDVCCVWRLDWHLTAQVEGEELSANYRCVSYFYYQTALTYLLNS